MKVYIWCHKRSGCEYWCVNKSLRLAREYMKKTYYSNDNLFDDKPVRIVKIPFAVSVLDPFRTCIYKNFNKIEK